MFDPFGANTGDPQGNALQVRGLANRRASDLLESQRPRSLGAPQILNGVLPDARWAGLFQALADQGVDKLKTGAASGIGDPGFFDQQDPHMQQRQALMRELMARDLNQGRR